MRPGRILLIVASLIVLALAGIHLPNGVLPNLGVQRVSGNCTYDGVDDWFCDSANDTQTLFGNYNGQFNGGSGNDTLTIAAGGSFGDNSTAAADGFFGDLGDDVLTNNGTVTGNIGMEESGGEGDGGGADSLVNNGLIVSDFRGTISIGGQTFTWTNFEFLFNFMQLNTVEPGTVITITVPRRANGSDVAAPVAVYCEAGGVELWAVGADGAGESNAVGSFAFSVPHADLAAGTTVSGSGATLSASGDGSFTVSATEADGKPYSFTGSCG